MWPRADPAFALAVTALAGWLWGSFLNQVVDRTPRTRAAAAGGAAPRPPPGVTLLHPARSVCFACGRPVAWHDNVPVLSYLWLRGRCRACGAAIGRRTLLLELATPCVLLAWHAAWLRAGWGLPVLLWGLAALSWALVAVARLAERRRWGPRFVLLGAALLGALVALLGPRLY